MFDLLVISGLYYLNNIQMASFLRLLKMNMNGFA